MDQTTQAAPTNWLDVLRTGISAWNDSQVAKAYASQQQAYNTAGGVGGQPQATASFSASPVLLIGGALLLGVVLFLALKR